MFKFFVDNQEKERRRALCIACEFYKPETRTCGTFRGMNPLGDKVSYQGQEYTLCGCIMPVKWQFSSAECSVGKWEKKITEELLEEIRAIVKDYRGKPTISSEAMRKIIDTYNKANSSNKEYTNCGKCVKQLIQEMTKLIKVADEND